MGTDQKNDVWLRSPYISTNYGYMPLAFSDEIVADDLVRKEDEPMTERGKEINKEIKELNDKIAELRDELEFEEFKAVAEVKAKKKQAVMKSYLDASFDSQQAFEMMQRDFN